MKTFRIERRDGLTALWLLAAVGLWLAVPNTAAAALGASGRVSSVSYLYEPQATLQDQDPDAAMTQLGRLSFRLQDADHSAWTLYYLGTLSGEVLNDGGDAMTNRIYRSYLQFRPRGSLQVQAGRVWANGGVGSGLYDGATVRWRTRPGTLVVAAGTRGFNEPGGWTAHDWNSNGWDQSGQASVFFRSREIAGKLSVGGSWSRSIWHGAEEGEHVGGLFLLRPAHGWTVAYDNDYELNQEVFRNQHLQGRYQFATGTAALSWTRREGYNEAYASSYIFRKFQFEPWFEDATGRSVQELRAHVLLQPRYWQGIRLAADLIEIYPDGLQRGDGLDVWAGGDWLRVGFRSMRGYRGDQDGVYGNLSWQVRPDLRAWADVNRASYSYGYLSDSVANPDRHVALTSRFGTDYSIGSNWFFSGSLERLQYPGVKHDYRGMLKISYRFDLGAQTREVW